MQSNSRDLLHLIAIGRLTPAEAERLIVAWNEGRELRFLLTAAVVFAAICQFHPGGLLADSVHTLNAFLTDSLATLHAISSTITHLLGESL